jgi:hypothetical protein
VAVIARLARPYRGPDPDGVPVFVRVSFPPPPRIYFPKRERMNVFVGYWTPRLAFPRFPTRVFVLQGWGPGVTCSGEVMAEYVEQEERASAKGE